MGGTIRSAAGPVSAQSAPPRGAGRATAAVGARHCHGYHPVTYGGLLDEIVRRATGVSVAHHVQTLIAEPLEVDTWMGRPGSRSPRRTRTSGGDFADPGEVREHYARKRPGIGAITEARALATMYAALLTKVAGVRLMNRDTVAQATRPRTDDHTVTSSNSDHPSNITNWDPMTEPERMIDGSTVIGIAKPPALSVLSTSANRLRTRRLGQLRPDRF